MYKLSSNVLREFFSPAFNLESLTYTNAGSSNVVIDVAGRPVVVTGNSIAFPAHGSVNTTNGIVVTSGKFTIKPSEKIKLLVLRRGPAVVSSEHLATHDLSGNAYNASTLATALAALGIIVRTNAGLTELQTT